MQKTKVFRLILVAVFVFSVMFPAGLFGLENQVNTAGTDRIFGTDRYETANKVADYGWADGAETVILAPGADANLVDALTAAPLAKANEAPILLTHANKLTASTKAQLTKMETQKVFVVSGVISDSVIAELEAMDITVTDLGGLNRFETSINIAKQLENVTDIVLTTAYSNADALSISSIAAAKGMPIILSEKEKLHPTVAAYLEEIKDNVAKAYVIGGTGVISDTVKDLLPGEATRISGADRYATNLAVLKTFAADLQYQNIFVASGLDAHLVDALVASSVAAGKTSPIVMVNQKAVLSTEAKALVESSLAATSKVIALGGNAIVSTEVETYNYVRAEDFGVMQLSGVNGYNVGFSLVDGQEIADVNYIVVSLYKGDVLLAQNLSTNKLFNLHVNQMSSPFNVDGDFHDDYWLYGDYNGTVLDVPTKAVIKVVYFNGKTVTVENTNLTGDPELLLTESQKHVKAEDFGVMQVSGVNGYTVGFSLIDGKKSYDLSEVEVSLYKDEKLLAVNTSTAKLLRLGVAQLSTPFNIDGTFQADGYWNYGSYNGTLEDVPNKAVIKVTYLNGRVFVAENTNLTGDPINLLSASITSDLAKDAATHVETDFNVTTDANRNAGEIVRVKAILLQGEKDKFELQYEQNGEYYPLSFDENNTALYGPQTGFPLGDVTSKFKIHFSKAGTYKVELQVVTVGDSSKVLATTTKEVVVTDVAPVIKSDLVETVVVNTETPFNVSTTTNSFKDEVVRVKITLTAGDSADVTLLYGAGAQFLPISFDQGIAWYGPQAGFNLADLTSQFKVLFAKAGDYAYTLEIVTVNGEKTLAQAAYSVKVVEKTTPEETTTQE